MGKRAEQLVNSLFSDLLGSSCVGNIVTGVSYDCVGRGTGVVPATQGIASTPYTYNYDTDKSGVQLIEIDFQNGRKCTYDRHRFAGDFKTQVIPTAARRCLGIPDEPLEGTIEGIEGILTI